MDSLLRSSSDVLISISSSFECDVADNGLEMFDAKSNLSEDERNVARSSFGVEDGDV